MIRDIQAPTRPGIYYPVASLQAEIHPTGQNFVDGSPIFKCGLLLDGGNNTTVSTQPELAGIVRFMVGAAWSCNQAGTIRYFRGGTSGIDLVIATGEITIEHQTFNFTGEIVVIVLEFTQIGGN
jgi:hypothetical protein